MSVQFLMSGTKFGDGLAFTCTKKSAGAPIASGMAELVTNDSSSGPTYYNCSFKKSGDMGRMRENYINYFTLSGPNGGPNNNVFNGPSGGKGSMFKNCVQSNTGILPPGNPNNLSMIQQYSSKGNSASACDFYKYY